MQKHFIHDTSFWEVWYAKHCFVYHWEHKNVTCVIARLGIFRHYCVFILGFFKQAVRCLKLLCNCHFICELASKHTRIAVEKVFVTRKLSKGVTKLTIAKVLQRDYWKIKRHATTSQQRHKKRVQPQL